MSKTKEQIMEDEYKKLVMNWEKAYQQSPSIFKAAHSAMGEYAKQQGILFSNWKEKLPPVQKCTVWPPAGSGCGTGLYSKSDEELYDEFLQSQSQ